ncbi:MAG: cell division protein ZapB [Deltaproteobacteria bacterium]
MTGEISLGRKIEESVPDGEQGLLSNLEGRVDHLLVKFQELMKERDEVAAALDSEREKVGQLEKRLERFTQDREKVKTRIDQLLHRLKGIDI